MFGGYPFEVEVLGEDRVGVEGLTLTIDQRDASKPPYGKVVQTRAEGVVGVGWPTPGPVRIKLDDGRGGAHATNFDVPATARVMPRCTITYSPLPARSTIVIQINATPPIEVPPALVTISRTGIRQQRVQKRVTPGEPPIRAEALPAGLYDVQLVTAFYGGPHYCLSLEDGGDPAAIVELADGATEHVEFDIRIGGRVRIRLDGPRRVVSASK